MSSLPRATSIHGRAVGDALLDVGDSKGEASSPTSDRSMSTRRGRRPLWRSWLGWVWGGSKYSGLACMALSSVSYSIMGLLVKLLAVQGIPSLESVMVRCTVISVLAGIQLRALQHPLLGSPAVRTLVLARAAIGFVALSAFFYSIQALPLRDATVLNFTTPVFTALLAAGLLQERWGAGEMAGSVCSFLGVLLVTQPEVLFRGGSAEKSAQDPLGVAMALLGAAAGALSYIIVRAVGKAGEPPLVCVFAFAALSAPLASLGAIFQHFRVPSAPQAVALLMVGLTAYSAQVFLTRSLQLEKAARASSVQYVKVVVTYLLGVAFLGEVPSLLGVCGALLICISASFLAYGSS